MYFFSALGAALRCDTGNRAASSAALNTTTRLCLLAAIAAALLCGAGCVKNEPALEWKLGEEGQAIYYFLVQLEAAASGDHEAFAEAGQKLLELVPDEGAYLDMAEFFLRRNELEEARVIARKGLADFPASLPLTLVLSDTYLQQEKFSEAAETLQFFTKAYPDNQDAMQELARVYLVSQRYEEFDALLRSVPASRMTPYLHYVKARSLLNRNQLAEGEKELRRVVREAPDMIDAWVNLGIALQLQGKHAAASPMFRKATEGDPDNLGLWLRLIDSELRAKRPAAARKALENAPPSPSLQMEAAMLFVEAKQYTTARNIFIQVRDTPGAPEEVHIYLAAIAMEHTRTPQEALRELAAIPPYSPLAIRALRWRMQILEEAGRITESVPIAQEHAEHNPDNPEFQIIYAQAASLAGDTDKGAAILRDARKKWPENADVAYALASLLELAKNRKEALELMEFVILQEPRNASALNYVGYTLAEENRELERAHDLIARAVAEEPEDPHIADSLAWVLYRMGDYEEAWKVIRKSIALGGDHATIWEHYGDIAAQIGNTGEARKGYANALKLDPEDPEAVKNKMRELQ